MPLGFFPSGSSGSGGADLGLLVHPWYPQLMDTNISAKCLLFAAHALRPNPPMLVYDGEW